MRVEFLRPVGNTPRGTVRELPDVTSVRLVGRGYVRPVVDTVVSESPRESSPGAARPDPADRKSDWVEYAVSRGLSREDAEGMTKRQLQEV